MIDANTFNLHFRPDYGFKDFDRLLRQLCLGVSVVAVRDIIASLHLEGRDLDPERLAGELNLSAVDAETIRYLAAFGDRGHWVHTFGSVHIAEICVGSWVGMCDLTTYVLATRAARAIAYWWEDENGGRGELGVRHRALSMQEMIEIVDTILLAQEPCMVARADWRNAYLDDPMVTIEVRSDFYPELARWYEAVVADWRAASPPR